MADCCAIFNKLAGAEGIEPSNAGIKIQCLTTWRRPSRSGTPITRPRRGRNPVKIAVPTRLSGRLRGWGCIVIRSLPPPPPTSHVRAKAEYRRVAQPGRALRSGRRGRRFESSLSDQSSLREDWPPSVALAKEVSHHPAPSPLAPYATELSAHLAARPWSVTNSLPAVAVRGAGFGAQPALV